MRNYILTFEEFLEAKLFKDGKIKVINDNDLGDKLLKIQKEDFITDTKLISQFTSKKYYNNKKIKLDIEWYDNHDHSINYRIKTRTNFDSISEFNFYIKNLLYKVFPDNINKMDKKGKYAIYDSEINLFTIFYIDPLKFNNIKIITIVKNINEEKDINIINI